MTIQFQGKTLYSFWRALMLPDIQRQCMLQQEHTSKDNQSSRNFKKNFKCMLRNIYVFKMSFIFKLNKAKKSYILKIILFMWWIIKVHVAQDFFPNILIVVVLTDPFTEVPCQVVLPDHIFQRCCTASVLLVTLFSLSLSALSSHLFTCQLQISNVNFFSQNSQIFL